MIVNEIWQKKFSSCHKNVKTVQGLEFSLQEVRNNFKDQLIKVSTCLRVGIIRHIHRWLGLEYSSGLQLAYPASPETLTSTCLLSRGCISAQMHEVLSVPIEVILIY